MILYIFIMFDNMIVLALDSWVSQFMCGYDLHRHFQYGSYDSHEWCMEPRLYVELMMLSKLMITSHVLQEMFSKDVSLCYKHVMLGLNSMVLLYSWIWGQLGLQELRKGKQRERKGKDWIENTLAWLITLQQIGPLYLTLQLSMSHHSLTLTVLHCH